jgi:hypothetical protein
MRKYAMNVSWLKIYQQLIEEMIKTDFPDSGFEVEHRWADQTTEALYILYDKRAIAFFETHTAPFGAMFTNLRTKDIDHGAPDFAETFKGLVRECLELALAGKTIVAPLRTNIARQIMQARKAALRSTKGHV